MYMQVCHQKAYPASDDAVNTGRRCWPSNIDDLFVEIPGFLPPRGTNRSESVSDTPNTDPGYNPILALCDL
jgi:hypothetical protein